MPLTKTHPLKKLRSLLHECTRLLIIGPLKIDKKTLKKVTQTLKPDLILFIDGGLRHRDMLSKNQQKISLSVGDGDSLPRKQTRKTNNPIDILLPAKKDYSDLAFALKAMVRPKNSLEDLCLLGLSTHLNEKRIDHLIFNLSSIEKITARLNIPIKMDRRFLFLPPGKNIIDYRGIFSVMAFSGTTLKITGKCDYQLNSWTRLGALSSRGLSNKGDGRIVIESRKTLLLYFPGSNFSS